VAFFQSSFITTLATAGTALLSISFVFAVTTQEVLGSCIFLFVKHPYDVADRVDIVGPERMAMTVDKISLLYTVFTRIDKMQVVQIPNIQLNNLWIENVTRSKAMKEAISVKVSFDTSFEDVELLRQEMEAFVRHSDNSRDFQPDFSIGVASIGNLDGLELSVAIKHKSNWHNEAVRASRRSKFICALALALKKVPINGPGGGGAALGSPDNPTYSVAVNDEFASTARTKFDDTADAARMVPTKSAATPAANAEQAAANSFNQPNATAAAYEGFGYDQASELRHSHVSSSPSMAGASSLAPMASTSGANLYAATSGSLHKTGSQGGRRKPGEGVAPIVHQGTTSLTLSPSTPARSQQFDEEAETGMTGMTRLDAQNSGLGVSGINRSASRSTVRSGGSAYAHGGGSRSASPRAYPSR